MTTPDVKFRLPAVDEFCTNLRTVITNSGGPAGFFTKLGTDASATLADLEVRHYTTLSHLLRDAEFRGRFVQKISEEGDRFFLESFLESWRLWSDLFPSENEFAKAALVVVYDQFSQPIPLTANDPQYCNSKLLIDSITKTIRVNTLLRLVLPNKELGGSHCFVIATTLERFLGTVRIMLGSIRSRGSEIGLFRIPDDRKIIDPAIEALAQIRELTDELQREFEGMRSADVTAHRDR